jgi:hypothetical protein
VRDLVYVGGLVTRTLKWILKKQDLVSADRINQAYAKVQWRALMSTVIKMAVLPRQCHNYEGKG